MSEVSEAVSDSQRSDSIRLRETRRPRAVGTLAPRWSAPVRLALLCLPLCLLLWACGGEKDSNEKGAAAGISQRAIDEALEAGERLFRDQRLEDAAAVAESIAVRAPDHWQGHELRGRIAAARALRAEQAGEPSRAAALRSASADDYLRTIGLRPQDALLQQAAGVALLAAGRDEEAVAVFARAGELAPQQWQHPLYQAQVLLRLERPAEARRALERVLRLRPEEPFAHASLAECLRQEGDLEAALDSIRVARRLEPGSMSFRVLEARLLRLMDRAREGLEILLATGEERWSEPAAVEEVALAWMALGEPARAAKAWETSHLRFPGNLAALGKAAETWRLAGDPVRAKLLEDQLQAP